MDYKKLSELYYSLETTSKRLEKTYFISKFLEKLSEKEVSIVVLLLQGRVFNQSERQHLGISEKLLIKALSIASGATEKKIFEEWKKIGDIGKVAEKLLEKKTQNTLFSEKLTLEKVYKTLIKVASLEGLGSTDTKTKLIANLLTNASEKEARYVSRTVIEDLRVGVADGTLRDAIAWAYLIPKEEIEYDLEEKSIEPKNREEYNSIMGFLQGAIDRSNDYPKIAEIAKKQGLEGIKKVPLTIGKPLKVMLAQKVGTIKEAFEKVGLPCALEYKYDGFRVTIHKNKEGKIKLFTRRLEEVTKQFPDVITAVKEKVKAETYLLDAEVVGYDTKTGKYKPFQEISQRIKRKYEIEKIAKKLPVELNVFDILYHNGESYIEKPYIQRREKLIEIIKEEKGRILHSKQKIVKNEKEAEEFYTESLNAGNEGIMVKKLDAIYKPGSRVGTMIKLKPVLETLDVVIIGAEWGTGKRSGWLTSFEIGIWDETTEEVLAIGRFGTGIKEKTEAKTGQDVTFEEMTEKLKPLIQKTTGRDAKIKPEILIEIKFEEIQKSPTYSSGYALRFPRFVRLREDRGIEDMTTLSQVENMYLEQRGRN